MKTPQDVAQRALDEERKVEIVTHVQALLRSREDAEEKIRNCANKIHDIDEKLEKIDWDSEIDMFSHMHMDNSDGRIDVIKRLVAEMNVEARS